MPKIADALAVQLKILRERKGWKITEVAERLGVSRQTIHAYESASGEASFGMIERFAKLYGVEETDLIGSIPEKPITAHEALQVLAGHLNPRKKASKRPKK